MVDYLLGGIIVGVLTFGAGMVFGVMFYEDGRKSR